MSEPATESTSLDPRRVPGVPPIRYRHILAVTLGNALEFYDFLVYLFFSIQIGQAFFPSASAYASLMLSLAAFGAGFIMRPVGAVVIGFYADRIGRKPAMLFCFAMIGGSMVVMALIPPESSIGVAAPILAVSARILQGFSLGGEIGSTTAFLLEAAPLRRTGLAVSWQQASQLAAVIVAGFVGLTLSLAMPPALLGTLGWRIAFLIGAVTLPFGLWLRATLPETLGVPAASDPQAGATRSTLLARSAPILIIGLVANGCQAISNYTGLYIVTFAQRTLGLSAASAFWAETIGAAASIAAVLWGGALSDRIGRRPVTLATGAVSLILIYPMFALIIELHSPTALIVGASVIMALGNVSVGAFCAALSEQLPMRIRGTAFGTIYAVSLALFGGTTQIVVTWLIRVTGSAYASAWYLLGATALQLAMLLMIPESAPGIRRLRRAGEIPN